MQIIFQNPDEVNLKIDSNTRLAHKLFSAYKNEYYKNIYYNKLVALNHKYQFNLSLDDSSKNGWLTTKQI